VTDKVDLKKSDAYQAKRGRFRLVEVPSQQYLMVDGSGDPNAGDFGVGLEALFPIAYAVKFASKRDLGRDYVVMPSEALWWADDLDVFTRRRDKSQWRWTAMVLQPDWITTDLIEEATAVVRARRPDVAIDRVRFDTLDEGLCVQTLYVGPYDDETETLRRLHDEFVPENSLRMTGHHHEIYLSDARRVAPEKLRTILRQPVRRV
jgi:hypothetical protein